MNKKLLLIIAIILVALVGFYFINTQKNGIGSNTISPTPKLFNGLKIPENMNGVNVLSSGFEPKEITIKTNTIVTWVNKSGGPVAINSDNHPTHLLYPFLNLGEFADGSSIQAKFEKPGKYTYHNHLNPEQKGTVIVE